MGLAPGVDNLAHTFGFAMGFISACAFFDLPPITRYARRRGQRIISVIVIIILYIISHAMMYNWPWNADSWCPFCYTLNCFELPLGCDRYDPESCSWFCRK